MNDSLMLGFTIGFLGGIALAITVAEIIRRRSKAANAQVKDMNERMKQ